MCSYRELQPHHVTHKPVACARCHHSMACKVHMSSAGGAREAHDAACSTKHCSAQAGQSRSVLWRAFQPHARQTHERVRTQARRATGFQGLLRLHSQRQQRGGHRVEAVALIDLRVQRDAPISPVYLVES